ncbi:hypothetical protein CUR178_06533 [Leishmania enriettii]|uniref:Uncharacterized protein n=1 Tax=Leishmania enriettii TaxID=5663 RepID=A0A836H1G6_LEIEN|nr:hypothetical protein CUR178_06533 [Leishmania enriettii]
MCGRRRATTLSITVSSSASRSARSWRIPSTEGTASFFDLSSTITLTNVIHGEHNYENSPCRSCFNSESRKLPRMAQGNIEKHAHDNLVSQRLLKRKQSNADITVENLAVVASLYEADEKNPFTALFRALIGDRGRDKRGGRTEVDQYPAIRFLVNIWGPSSISVAQQVNEVVPKKDPGDLSK